MAGQHVACSHGVPVNQLQLLLICKALTVRLYAGAQAKAVKAELVHALHSADMAGSWHTLPAGQQVCGCCRVVHHHCVALLVNNNLILQGKAATSSAATAQVLFCTQHWAQHSTAHYRKVAPKAFPRAVGSCWDGVGSCWDGVACMQGAVL